MQFTTNECNVIIAMSCVSYRALLLSIAIAPVRNLAIFCILRLWNWKLWPREFFWRRSYFFHNIIFFCKNGQNCWFKPLLFLTSPNQFGMVLFLYKNVSYYPNIDFNTKNRDIVQFFKYWFFQLNRANIFAFS